MSHAEVIQRNHDILQRCLSINFYVIDYLRAEGVLSELQENDLKTEKNPLRQRILFFPWLKEVSYDQYESFLKVMKETEQEHVANLLKGSTEEDLLPLSNVVYDRLVKIRHKLANVTRIDDELIAELRCLQAISMTDSEEIRAEKVDYTKVSKLISAIMRRSNHSYKSFQMALRKTLQTAAANYLCEGEMPAVHVKNNRPDLDGPLSHAFNDVIMNKTTDDPVTNDLLAKLNGVNLYPVKAQPGQSIVIFIYCQKVDSAVNFTQLFNSGGLQYIIERILNRLLLKIEPNNTQALDTRINLEDDDMSSVEEFIGIEGWSREDPTRQNSPASSKQTIVVSQIHPNMSKKLLEMLCGGRIIETIDYNLGQGTAIITFEYPTGNMDKTPGIKFHKESSYATDCSICTEIFTNPKFLPCAHTFCLHCLETYVADKPGDQLACPLCRSKFVIPDEGLCKLPNNFILAKILEIGKMAMVAETEAACGLCFEEESIAKKYCIDCELKLCKRCSQYHDRIKQCQNHQVVELESQANVRDLNFGGSYCEHHPEELVKMFCHNDNVAICLICCVESHQFHRCSNVDNAAGQVIEQLLGDMQKVAERRSEYEEAFQRLEKLKKEFLDGNFKAEERIRKSRDKINKLIDQQADLLVQNLSSVTERNLKYFETKKQNMERFKAMIDSYQRYCDELLTRRSALEICRAANQMQNRAGSIEKQAANCTPDDFYFDEIYFNFPNLEVHTKHRENSNFVGQLTIKRSRESFSVYSPGESLGIVTKFLPMDFGAVEVITKYMKNELQKIETELRECSGSVSASQDEPGFVIRGDEAGLAKAKRDLLILTETISMYDHDIDRPGIPAYFYSKHGKEVLRGIQINHKVSIQLDNTQSRAKPQVEAGDWAERCRVEVRPGKFMILMRGDITKFKGDAIVSAANEDLKHIGGVAAAIAEAAGPRLEEECLSRTKLEGKLLPGQVCVTTAGKLPCKRVIHAVGPRWSGGNADEENILAMAVDSSLCAADNDGLKDIAMPSISTGIFGFPLDRATNIMVDAVKSYFIDNPSTRVCEVFFIDRDSRAVASLEGKLRTIQVDIPMENLGAKRGRRKVPEEPSFRPSQNEELQPNTSQREDQAGPTQRTGTAFAPPQQSQEQHEQRQPQHLSRIILSIYALSPKAINDVLKDIEEVIKEYIIDKILDSPQDQERIARLNPEQVGRIKNMINVFPVQIEVETGRMKRIRIRGPPMEVTSVIDQVHNIFQEAQDKQIKQKEDEWIANVAQWEYEDEGYFEKYPPEINAIIERAFRDKKPYADWEEEHGQYQLTFQTMIEEFTTNSGAPPVKVRRVAKDMDVPGNWETMKNEELKMVTLSVTDQEYRDVAKAALSTAQTTVRQIVKIDRIQNKKLYNQYVVRKATMDAENPKVKNEMTLWHGTSADTLECINRHGFSRSYCGKNEVVYGRGVYFAKNFNYSAQNTYSPPDATGLKHIYRCKVLTGEYTLGNQSMIMPPPKPGSTTTKYDSTVDNATAPTIFVIYYDTQAYPEYLIYFK